MVIINALATPLLRKRLLKALANLHFFYQQNNTELLKFEKGTRQKARASVLRTRAGKRIARPAAVSVFFAAAERDRMEALLISQGRGIRPPGNGTPPPENG